MYVMYVCNVRTYLCMYVCMYLRAYACMYVCVFSCICNSHHSHHLALLALRSARTPPPFHHYHPRSPSPPTDSLSAHVQPEQFLAEKGSCRHWYCYWQMSEVLKEVLQHFVEHQEAMLHSSILTFFSVSE